MRINPVRDAVHGNPVCDASVTISRVFHAVHAHPCASSVVCFTPCMHTRVHPACPRACIAQLHHANCTARGVLNCTAPSCFRLLIPPPHFPTSPPSTPSLSQTPRDLSFASAH
eukprot:2800862-Rhodomonas_salina.1